MSQQDTIIIKLREMILNGSLAPGERIVEVTLAERLKVSRTPVRHALSILEKEGLLVTTESRACFVRAFSLQYIIDAIGVRGVLEGLAARTVAARELPASVREQLQQCLRDGDVILDKGFLVSGDLEAFAEMNTVFHDCIADAAQNKALSNAIAMNNILPFASPGAIAFNLDNPVKCAEQLRLLQQAQAQHHAIHEALINGQSARVDALMREHAYVAIANVKLTRFGHDDNAEASSPA
ncbi:MAG: GntR family transcriptional regulator [Pseudomonadota bacterium]